MTKTTKTTVTPQDLHREDFKRFVIENAEPWHRAHLGRLYEDWEMWNRRFFCGTLTPPYIMFSVPNCTRAYGDYSPITGFGGWSQIRIRRTLLTGHHRDVLSGDEHFEGRFRFITDVLLHETIHQFQQEVLGKPEKSYKGHGTIFRDKCNEIGLNLGLKPVRVAKARGKIKDLPSCAQFPHCVRPSDFYLGAIKAEVAGAKEKNNEKDLKFKKAEESLFLLVAAAQDYSRRWSEISDEEAADFYNRFAVLNSHPKNQLTKLCGSAKELDKAIKNSIGSNI